LGFGAKDHSDQRHREVRTISARPVRERRFGDWCLAYSLASAPFDRLVDLSHRRQGLTGKTLLLEMMRRFKASAPDVLE
jgi:hypothetical protein